MFILPVLTLFLTTIHGYKINDQLHRELESEPIVLDGNVDEWSILHRVYPQVWELPTLDPNFEIFGKHDKPNETYYFAIKSKGDDAIGAATTIYLDTDQTANPATSLGSAESEFYIECSISAAGEPIFQLFNPNPWALVGDVPHVFSADGKIVEIAVPVALIRGDTPSVIGDIDFFVDINNAKYFPAYFSAPWFTATHFDLPQRTKGPTSKRVAIVFSPESETKLFGGGEVNEYIYGQLYASIQHQCMNAGIPYDLIYFDDVKNLQKIVNYDTLVFPYNAFVLQEDLELVLYNLRLAVHYYGIGIITGDNFLTDPAGANPTPRTNPYQGMAELLGVTIYGYGAGNLTISVGDDTHPVMAGYAAGEIVLEYPTGFYNHYGAIDAANFKTSSSVKPLAQTVTASTKHSSLLAIETVSGARHVHFATCSIMADGNLVWQALRWAVFGEVNTVGLQISRQDSVFSARNDMDQTRFISDFDLYIKPLLEKYLVPWNKKYQFVGTDFINIGNNPAEGEYTDWALAGPVYEQYMAMGDEIASHTYTHPYFISQLSEAELTYEFEGSGLVLEQELGLSLPTIGYAQPGNPESLSVVKFLDKLGCYYLSGTYTGKGIGFPSTFGFLRPDAKMAFMAPNMFSDYNMLSFKKLTPEETFVIWTQQYNELRNHANTPIIHYHWHDYGPFEYSAALFEDTIAMAYKGGSEFIVNKEMVERMKVMKSHELKISKVEDVVTVSVTSSVGSFGTLALDAGCKESEVIESVDGWYAYSDKKVILPKNGGTFAIRKGASANAMKTRIVSLPMRAELLKVSGDDTMIEFSFVGNGTVTVKLNEKFAGNLKGIGADTINMIDATTMEMTFDSSAPVKVGSIVMKQPGQIQLEQRVRIEKTSSQKNVCDSPYQGVQKGGKLKFKFNSGSTIVSGQTSAAISTSWRPSCSFSSRVLISTEASYTTAYYRKNKIFFGDVRCGDEFWTTGTIDKTTYIHVAQGLRVQTTRLITSCAQPLAVDDVYGSVQLTSFVDKTGQTYQAAHPPNLSPGLADYAAQEPGTGPVGKLGDTIVYTYVVTNPLENTPLCNVRLEDLKDDVNGQYSASVVKQINDSLTIVSGNNDNGDRCLEKGEQWVYTYNYVYNKATAGNVAAASTARATDYLNEVRQASDTAHYSINA